MEEGKIATAWAQFGATERIINVYISACATRSALLAWGRLGSISAPLVNQSRFTSAIERSGRKKKGR
jgi:hypothetical protein